MGTRRKRASSSGSNPTWTDKAGVIIASVALVFSGIALLKSCTANDIAEQANNTAREGNELGREANAIALEGRSFTETEVARSHVPTMHFGYFIA